MENIEEKQALDQELNGSASNKCLHDQVEKENTCGHCNNGQPNHEHEMCSCGHEGHHHHHDDHECCGHCHHDQTNHDHVECSCGHEGHHHHHDDHECCGHHGYHQHSGDYECCGHCHSHDHHLEDWDQGRTVNFEGEAPANILTIWDTLTDPDKIAMWLPGLRFESLTPGAAMHFGQGDYMVLDVEEGQVFAFTWEQGTIAIQLVELSDTTTYLNLSYWLDQVDSTSINHVALWLVALQRIADLASGKPLSNLERAIQETKPNIEQVLFGKQDQATFEG